MATLPKPPSWLTRVLYVAVILVILESFSRAFVEPSRLYSRFHTWPKWNEWRHQVRFWEKHRDSIDLESLAVRSGYDADLGWDFELEGDRIRGVAPIQPLAERDTTRIVVVGDSYTYGTELGEADNFSAILNSRDNNIEILNMGVPGYGVDQAVLKYQKFGQTFHPHLVLLAIYVTDYERSSINFTFFAKPLFQIDSNELRLTNHPVPPPDAELHRI